MSESVRYQSLLNRNDEMARENSKLREQLRKLKLLLRHVYSKTHVRKYDRYTQTDLIEIRKYDDNGAELILGDSIFLNQNSGRRSSTILSRGFATILTPDMVRNQGSLFLDLMSEEKANVFINDNTFHHESNENTSQLLQFPEKSPEEKTAATLQNWKLSVTPRRKSRSVYTGAAPCSPSSGDVWGQRDAVGTPAPHLETAAAAGGGGGGGTRSKIGASSLQQGNTPSNSLMESWEASPLLSADLCPRSASPMTSTAHSALNMSHEDTDSASTAEVGSRLFPERESRRKVVSYREPSLVTKVRKGHRFF